MQKDQMTRRRRTFVGRLMTIALIPALAGVMACIELPVPVGDPERSRVDPSLTGVWIGSDGTDGAVLILEAYDKRTWLASYVGISCVESGEDEIDECGNRTIEDVLSTGDLETEGIWISKAWVTELEGAQFMTWQTMVNPKTEHGLEPQSWVVYRVRRPDDGTLVLDWLDNSFEDLKEVESRRQAERIIRRNVDNPELYGGDSADSDTQFEFRRLPQELYDDIQDIEVLGDPFE